EDEYVLVFRGTDDDVFAGVWNDWINNVDQARGQFAPQYLAAMELAVDLIDLTAFSPNNLIATGHSLGGGLASAAAVVAGIPADTFNAAGLHLDTLYERDGNGNPIPDGMGGFEEI